MIVNCYKSKQNDNPNILVRECRVIISKELGVGEKTVSNTIMEYNNSKNVKSPNKKRNKKSYKYTFDEFHRNAVRQHVHVFWRNKTIPTLAKIFRLLKMTNYYRPFLKLICTTY